MAEFPIDEIYRRVARFDARRDDKDVIVGSGSGFFYWYNYEIFFATRRDYLIVEERPFLPDSIILYTNSESNLQNTKVTLPLYDKEEKPVWRVISSKTEEIFVSIPIPRAMLKLDFASFFVALARLPSVVHLPVDDITLNIPVSIGVSLSDYFFYSNSKNEKTFQKMVEKDGDFAINRKGFARDMIEMVLVLLQHNLDKIEEISEKKSMEGQGEHALSNRRHDNLISELEKIMTQFSDVLEPSISDRIQNISTILKDHNFEDYLTAKHLIRKVLLSLGQNILFTQ